MQWIVKEIIKVLKVVIGVWWRKNTFQITKYPTQGFNGAVKGKECPKDIIQDCNTNAVCPK